MKIRLLHTALMLSGLMLAGCGGPGADSLRNSFAEQLAANRFVQGFQRNGNELLFTAPGADGGTAKWRVTIDSAEIESTDNEAQPYRGIVKSSWYSDGRPVEPLGKNSNLPVELVSNGLSQDCWAFWEKEGGKWSWE